jgi:hypothetical protein
VTHLLSLVTGAVVGVAALAVHRSGPGWLALAVLVSVGTSGWLLTGASPGLTATFALGWLVAFGVAVMGRREGDYVVASDLPGHVLSGTAFALVVLGVVAVGRSGAGRPT